MTDSTITDASFGDENKYCNRTVIKIMAQGCHSFIPVKNNIWIKK